MKKMTKMSFGNIQGVLSREEMRKIMAGSGSKECGVCTPFGGGSAQTCFTNVNNGQCEGCDNMCTL